MAAVADFWAADWGRDAAYPLTGPVTDLFGSHAQNEATWLDVTGSLLVTMVLRSALFTMSKAWFLNFGRMLEKALVVEKWVRYRGSTSKA